MSSEAVNTRARGIEDWLVPRLAGALGVPAAEIDAKAPLSRYGLGSVEAVVLVGDLEEWLGVPLEPTLLWDHPTIAGLAVHLAQDGLIPAAAIEGAIA